MKGREQQQWAQQAINTETEKQMQQADTRETSTNQRPKRRIIKPQHLKDFV